MNPWNRAFTSSVINASSMAKHRTMVATRARTIFCTRPLAAPFKPRMTSVLTAVSTMPRAIGKLNSNLNANAAPRTSAISVAMMAISAIAQCASVAGRP
ncbi:hypothetical protein D3C87_1450970 [compost metagenome]